MSPELSPALIAFLFWARTDPSVEGLRQLVEDNGFFGTVRLVWAFSAGKGQRPRG